METSYHFLCSHCDLASSRNRCYECGAETSERYQIPMSAGSMRRDLDRLDTMWDEMSHRETASETY